MIDRVTAEAVEGMFDGVGDEDIILERRKGGPENERWSLRFKSSGKLYMGSTLISVLLLAMRSSVEEDRCDSQGSLPLRDNSASMCP